ncbi:hypothetical protein ACYOEI_31720, partial [Singulisphaera rosea]
FTSASRPETDGECSHCRGTIEPGSLLYCLKCHTSGFDGQLAAQRRIVGVPPADPPKRNPTDPIPLPAPAKRPDVQKAKPATPEKMTRREARAIRYSESQRGDTHGEAPEGR